MTFDQIRKQGITGFLDKAVTVRARVTWEYSTVKIPEDPKPMQELANTAGPLRVSFDEPAFADVNAAKHFSAIGAEIKKVKDNSGKEQYSFAGVTLATGQEYALTLRIKLRSRFKPEMLQNPAFVTQSNNPRYWSQTFEVEIVKVAAGP